MPLALAAIVFGVAYLVVARRDRKRYQAAVEKRLDLVCRIAGA